MALGSLTDEVQLFTNKSELKEFLEEGSARSHSKGFVPTMGALHSGHMSLLRKCRQDNDITVVSIFINPTQFNDKKDLAAYPVTTEADLKMLEAEHCDVVFIPGRSEMYPEGESTFKHLDFGHLGKTLEGTHRPGHFSGVATVVSKLFDAVEPDRAYFGEKDYQQLLIIKKLVELEQRNIEIVSCPIIREPDGLAMSSRNNLLSKSEREKAPLLYEVLTESKYMLRYKQASEVRQWVKEQFEGNRYFTLEYFEIADACNLMPLDVVKGEGQVIGLIAARLGNVRLIDNIRF